MVNWLRLKSIIASCEDTSNAFVIVTEYNNQVLGYLVHKVERIINTNWETIHAPPKGAGKNNYLTAVTDLNGELVEILDVEKVLAEVAPRSEEVSQDIVDIVLKGRPGAVSFPGANPRHAHEFAFFDDHPLPDDKVLCPGMIEPQSPYIEHPDLIAQRIGRYADRLGRERVMAGVDCGFSVHAGSNSLDPEIVWAKLAALAEGAEIASKQYWR